MKFNIYSTKVNEDLKKEKPNPKNAAGSFENRKFWKIIFVPMTSNADTEDFISEESMRKRSQENIQVVTLSRKDDSRKKPKKKFKDWIDATFPMKEDSVKSRFMLRLLNRPDKDYEEFREWRMDPFILLQKGFFFS